MKKLQLFALVMLFMTVFSANAAPSSEENAIVGTWESAQNEDIDLGDGAKMNMDGALFSTFNEDKTGKLEGSIRITLPFSEGGYSNTFYTDFAINGTLKWSIDGVVLTQKGEEVNITSDGIKAEKDDAMAKQVISMLKQIFDPMMAQIKQTFKEGTKDTILSLNVNEMSLKSATDAASDITVWKRVK